MVSHYNYGPWHSFDTNSAPIIFRITEQSLFEWKYPRVHLQTIRPSLSALVKQQGIIRDDSSILLSWMLASSDICNRLVFFSYFKQDSSRRYIRKDSACSCVGFQFGWLFFPCTPFFCVRCSSTSWRACNILLNICLVLTHYDTISSFLLLSILQLFYSIS
jgi:hypothetical protein